MCIVILINANGKYLIVFNDIARRQGTVSVIFVTQIAIIYIYTYT